MQATNIMNPQVVSPAPLPRTQGRVTRLFRAITSNPKITVGVSIVVFFILIALAAPLLTPYDPNAHLVRGSHAPSLAHIFGTSGLGQDLFAQIVYGARISLVIGFIAAIGSTVLQVIFGLTSAYFGGVVDEVLSLVINVFLVLPGLPLAIVLASLASAGSASKNEFVIALVLLFTSWSYGARVLRSQTLSLKEREFVAAARATGETSFRLIFAEILPNEIALVASTFIGTFVYAIGAEVALEYLGLGDPSQASWGNILFWAQNDGALIIGHWWQFVPAGLCVAVLCSGLAFINFGMDELANPHLREKAPSLLKRKSASKQRKDVTV
jgi:peptide/nickel transport system permease protein